MSSTWGLRHDSCPTLPVPSQTIADATRLLVVSPAGQDTDLVVGCWMVVGAMADDQIPTNRAAISHQSIHPLLERVSGQCGVKVDHYERFGAADRFILLSGGDTSGMGSAGR